MSVKKIILLIIIVLVSIGLTILLLVLLNVGKKSPVEARGIRPTDSYVFKDLTDINGLPKFASTPSESKGWKKQPAGISDPTFVNVSYTSENSCTFDATSQLLADTNKDTKDYNLSKAQAELAAKSEEGTATDPYVISLESTQGPAELYSAIYYPKIVFVHGTGTTPTKVGGSKKVDGAYTTFEAVRLIQKPLQYEAATTLSTVKNAAPIAPMIPAITLKYSCKTADFNVNDAVAFVQQLKIDFTSTAKITTPTTGK
jgi:hypothetical protein